MLSDWCARSTALCVPQLLPGRGSLSDSQVVCREQLLIASALLWAESESRQALRAVVGDRDACNLLKGTVRLSGVAHQFRSIPVDLVEIFAIRRQPAIAWAAANHSIDCSESAISRDLRACRILRDFQPFAV